MRDRVDLGAEAARAIDTLYVHNVPRLQVKVGELAKILAEKGRTGAQIATATGMTPGTFSRVRNGGPCGRMVARAIAGELGVPLEQLFIAAADVVRQDASTAQSGGAE
jgi:hypothetical protein